jgi:hypothetical protein
MIGRNRPRMVAVAPIESSRVLPVFSFFATPLGNR